jgi:transforming growth factor-beta-induced protein
MLKQLLFASKVLLFLVLALTLQNCEEDTYSATTESPIEMENQIALDEAEELETLTTDDDVETRTYTRVTFNTLNQALKCTNLNSALFSGHKTIYAPTDAAFAKLGLTADNVCEALDVETLTNILLYHVVDRNVPLTERGCVEMLNGDITQVSVRNRGLFINRSNISLVFSQKGSNYLLRVYAIGDVLQVPDKNIVETASGASQFSSLVAAVLAANPAIAQALSDEDQILTVFAPTNEAFNNLIRQLGATSLQDLVNRVGVEALSTILLYHVVDGCAFSNDLQQGQQLTTLQGEKLRVDLRNLAIIDKTNTPARLDPNGLDILTSNGIVHTINKVLLPDAILQNL